MTFFVVLSIGWSGIIFGVSLYLVFLRMLRENHAETFVLLGSPSLLLNSGFRLRMTRFILRREYHAIGDPRLTRVGDALLFGWFVSGAFAMWVIYPFLVLIYRDLTG